MRITGLTPGATYHFRVRSADAAGNATSSPATPARFAMPVSRVPAATVIDAGTLRGGTVAGLTANDNVFYEVNSTTSGTRTSSFYGSFTGVPTTLTGLRVSAISKNSRNCTQVIAIWRWSDSTWQTLNSSTVGTAEVARPDLVPAGAASAYVSAGGELRVRLRCTTTANFFASGEQLSISYTPPVT
jgi:hypothetical protein